MTTLGAALDRRELLTLRSGTFRVDVSEDEVRLVAGHQAESFQQLSCGAQQVLRRLAGTPSAAEDLRRLGAESDDVGDFLDRLWEGGWLGLTVAYGDSIQYILDPVRPPPPRQQPLGNLVLSRHALMRRVDDEMVIESPLSWCDFRLSSATAVRLVAKFATHDKDIDGEGGEADRGVLEDLWWAGLLVERDGEENSQLSSLQWSPHELWFHERSRGGHRSYGSNSFGGTRWADGRFDPLPAQHEPRFAGPRIALAKADLAELRASDPPLTTVLEDRRSIREHDDERPLTVEEIGRFLYRCARTRGIVTYEGVEYKSRPHPSGGSTYELEIYPVIRHVAGLDSGMYHYNAETHELVLVAEHGTETKRLLRRARMAARKREEPQVVFVISARFGRIMWNYQSMGYALILKHVGVLYQTMYLVATAMGFAACGLGAGDSVLFGEATGIDQKAEDSVGEFILGRPGERLAEVNP